MKKYLIAIATLAIALSPNFVSAKEADNLEKVAETTKYIKTVTEKDNLQAHAYSSNTVNFAKSYSVEVSEEEYNNAKETEVSTNVSTTVETTYKRLTTTISQDGGYYQYKVQLNWKTMPAVRSYDIIGIGMNQSVKLASNVYYEQYYCFSGGSCGTSGVHTPKISSTGAGTVFQIMSGNLSTLRLTMYFNVAKNTSSTIVRQDAYGDYSHATSSISYSNAQNYSIGAQGIYLGNSITGYYDSIQAADATWTGSW